MTRKFMQKALLVLLLFVQLGAFAQIDLNTKLPIDPKIKIGKLDNGLTYYIKENKKPEKKVELRLVINAGSINEDDDQQGLAHMAEHMAFNGTKNFKKNDLVSFLQSIGVEFGADLNAYTSFDETVYILPIPLDKPDNLEKGFQIIEDWAHQVSYTDKDIEDERGVILEELRLGRGADDRMQRKILPKYFAGSKYADRLPGGLDSIIKNFKPDAIRRFYKDWYRPNLMAVMVVGDITNAKAEEMIKKHFAGLVNPPNPRERVYADMPAYKNNDAMVVTDKEATMYIADVTYSSIATKPSLTLAEYKYDIVKNLFTTLLNLRLAEFTQKQDPPFLQSGASFSGYARNFESFSAYVVAGNKDAGKALTVAVEEVERAKRFGFTQAELDRAKANVLSRMQRAFNEKDKTESGQLIEEFVRNFLTQESMPGIEKELEYHKAIVPAITLQEVNDIAKELQKTPNYFSSLMGPTPAEANKIPNAAELMAIADNISKRTDLKPYEEKIIATNLIETLRPAGKVIKETVNAVAGTKVWTLSNGTSVTIKKTNFKNDEIMLGARRPGGTGNYGLADKYNANYATGVVASMGFGNFSPIDLQKALAGKVANVGASLTGTTEGFSGSSSVKDLETMLQLLYLRVTAPRMDTGLYKSFIQKNKAQSTFAMADPQTAFVDTLFKTIYSNNPLRPVSVPHPEFYDQVELKRAVEIYKERFSDVTGMHYVFVGNIDEKKLKPLVEKYIASLPANGKKSTWKDNGLRTAKGNIALNIAKGQADKSLILALQTGEIKYSEDLELKGNAVSEILNIRIIEELREKIQGIYTGGTFSQFTKVPYESYQFFTQLPCGPDKVDTLLLAMNAEIAKLKKEGPSAADLEKVKQQWLEQDKEAMKDNGNWRNQLLDNKFPGNDMNRFLNFSKIVKALTPKEIQQAANVLLNNKNVVTAVLKPEATPPPVPQVTGNRKNEIVQIIELTADEFTVDVYDNGDVDGDIITLYYNGQPVISKASLTEKPTSIKLKLDKNKQGALTMFAENLGSVPPNTALAIITCAGQRFEVRISSDNDKNGTVVFKMK